jgi:hypothetical protein
MQIISYRVNGATSNIERVHLYKDSGATAGTEGDPFTGLDNTSSGLSISTIANNEATAVTDTSAATSSVETIATLGTYATPTSGFVRFKEVDATAHPGLYELQWEDARYAVTDAKYLDICITGVTDLSTFHGRIYLDVLDEAGLRAALGLASANLDTQLGAIPNNTEFAARTILTGEYATQLDLANIDAKIDDLGDGTTTVSTDVVSVAGETIVANGTGGQKYGGA